MVVSNTNKKNKKVIVSKSLVKAFVEIQKGHVYPSVICKAENYYKFSPIPELTGLGVIEFEKLIARMMLDGYEVKQPKFKYIKLNSSNFTDLHWYVNYDLKDMNYTLGDCVQHEGVNVTQFTQEQVDKFMNGEEMSDVMWTTEDVPDEPEKEDIEND